MPSNGCISWTAYARGTAVCTRRILVEHTHPRRDWLRTNRNKLYWLCLIDIPDLELRTEKLVCLLAETKIIDLSQECQAKEAQRVKNLAVERKNPRVTEQMTHRLLRLTLSKKEFEALFRESRRGSIGEPW
jgi:hypothetical protein